ncbi:MAG TPA: hypothetical protein VHE99_03385 [Gammaproteobacteria bacterium]|nr:hypothetical protein [Gammaproteobacteria bacterium]
MADEKRPAQDLSTILSGRTSLISLTCFALALYGILSSEQGTPAFKLALGTALVSSGFFIRELKKLWPDDEEGELAEQMANGIAKAVLPSLMPR